MNKRMLPFERKMEITRTKKFLAETDSSIIRAFEDILTILVDTNVIDRRLIPEVVYENINTRRILRERLIVLLEEDKK